LLNNQARQIVEPLPYTARDIKSRAGHLVKALHNAHEAIHTIIDVGKIELLLFAKDSDMPIAESVIDEQRNNSLGHVIAAIHVGEPRNYWLDVITLAIGMKQRLAGVLRGGIWRLNAGYVRQMLRAFAT